MISMRPDEVVHYEIRIAGRVSNGDDLEWYRHRNCFQNIGQKPTSGKELGRKSYVSTCNFCNGI
jgi:hypothetical protein